MDVPKRCSVGRGSTRLGVVLVAALGVHVAGGGMASAQVPNPDPSPPPGAALMTDILGWLKYGALWASVAALLVGAIAIGVGHFGSNYGASSAGRKWLLGGIGCAALAALAWTFASTVYNSTS